ncbi:MAG: DNA-3-methyladenine glycosylase [Halobacteriales archaeon]
MDAIRTDPVLSGLIEEHGELELVPADDIFARFVTSIVRQQLSMESASAIRERLFERFEVSPRELRAADVEALQSVGLSESKATYVRTAATAFDERGYSRGSFDGMDDEAVIEELTGIRGVGPWTAKMFLLFCLAREDVFPIEDLGIRKGMADLYGIEDRPAMVDRAENWRPHRSYASLYLWRATD